MMSLKDARKDLTAQLNLVNYVMKNCPNARQDDDRFVDDSVTIRNCDGFVFSLPDRRTTGLIFAQVTPYKKLKRRPNEKDPVRVFGSKDYDLAAHHIELLLNNIDHREALRILQKALSCQGGRAA